MCRPPSWFVVVSAPSPAMDKVDVNGDGAEPLYAWMKEAKKEGGIAAAMGNDIKWQGRSVGRPADQADHSLDVLHWLCTSTLCKCGSLTT